MLFRSIDSISHEWEGRGGIVYIADSMTGNSFANWAKITPRHNAFVDSMINCKKHLIATLRSKQDYVIADKNGNELTGNEYKRFIEEVNPLYTFSDLIYQAIFSYLADGNLYLYQNVPSMYERANSKTISRLDVLNPNYVSIDE